MILLYTLPSFLPYIGVIFAAILSFWTRLLDKVECILFIYHGRQVWSLTSWFHPCPLCGRAEVLFLFVLYPSRRSLYWLIQQVIFLYLLVRFLRSRHLAPRVKVLIHLLHLIASILLNSPWNMTELRSSVPITPLTMASICSSDTRC